ncbi:MAG: hypothetical protein PHT40_00870 [Patescibacteria group bacterium]|nr:hypothetical protein [Patescibacteria group bacterium]
MFTTKQLICALIILLSLPATLILLATFWPLGIIAGLICGKALENFFATAKQITF